MGGERERAGICKQGFHLICKNRHCSGINLHLSSGKESGAHLTVNGLGMAVRCTGEHCVTPQRTGAIDQYGMSHIVRTARYNETCRVKHMDSIKVGGKKQGYMRKYVRKIWNA